MKCTNKRKLAVAVTSLAATSEELKQVESVLTKLSNYFDVVPLPDLRSNDIFGSQSVSKRLDSLNSALSTADIVLTYNGGFNSVELLDRFNEIIDTPDAVLVGYSDNTLLVNALPASKKARGYLGPMLATMIRNPGLVDQWIINLNAWLDGDFARIDQQYNEIGLSVLQPGTMEGRVLGGNAYTFDLLQGTGLAPSFESPFIYILEGEDFITDKSRVWQDTVRNFDSIMLQPGARENLSGLLIGKFPDSYTLPVRELELSIQKRSYLADIPIAYNVPRGYAQPALFLPVGEPVKIQLSANNTINFNKVY